VEGSTENPENNKEEDRRVLNPSRLRGMVVLRTETRSFEPWRKESLRELDMGGGLQEGKKNGLTEWRWTGADKTSKEN